MRLVLIEPWVSTEKVAAHLGKPTCWVLDRAGDLGIPRVKVANQWRYRLSDVDAWMLGQAA